jgi:hypothetical protein
MNIANHERVEDNIRVLDEGSWKLGKICRRTIVYRTISIAVDFLLPYLASFILGIPQVECFAIGAFSTVGCAIINTALYVFVEKKVC